jgi:hypothetical protein
MEDDINGRRPQTKTTTMEDDLIVIFDSTSKFKLKQAITAKPELGTAQPQLAYMFVHNKVIK